MWHPQLAKSQTLCRVCQSRLPLPYFNLGRQPFANAIRLPAESVDPEYSVPLAVTACPVCGLSQLTYVANPELLYKHYVYRSGYSAAWREHCEGLAAQWAKPGLRVVEIASNDGTLAKMFQERGATVVGVEPAEDFADSGYPVVTQFWTQFLAEKKFKGAANLIVAQNVLGHVHDVHDFMAGIATALAPQGRAVIEVPYVVDLLKACAFDTIYHEHVSYWSLTAIQHLCAKHGLAVLHVARLPVHGGSIRVTIGKASEAAGVDDPTPRTLLLAEKHHLRAAAYKSFSYRATDRIARIAEHLQGRTYVGFGAAAKTTVMLGVLGVDCFPQVVYDDNPAKWGHCIPGTHVPIEAPPASWRRVKESCAVFAWNWADDIIHRLRSSGYRAPIFVTLPKPRWHTS